jgi:hypothetical protein
MGESMDSSQPMDDIEVGLQSIAVSPADVGASPDLKRKMFLAGL